MSHRFIPATAADLPPPNPIRPQLKVTRGVRNFNPGNLDRTTPRTPWRGLLPEDEYPHSHEAQVNGGRFEVFISPEWGIRALVRVLVTYYERHGLNTVDGIINRWAPPTENVTEAYVDAVAREVGVEPRQPIAVTDIYILRPLVEAIIAHENAGYRYPDDVLREGLRLAGFEAAQPVALTPAVRSAGMVAAPVVVGGVVTATVEAVNTVAPHIEAFKALAGLVQGGGVAVAALLSVLALAGWGFAYSKRAKRRAETGT